VDDGETNVTEDVATAPARNLRKIAIAAVVLALAFAAWGGWSYWQATKDSGGVIAARDEVLTSGRAAVATLTTLDHKDIDAGYDRWLAASTGALHDELESSKEAGKEQIRQAKTVTAATIVDAAMTDIDTGQGRAKLMAVVEISVTPDGGQAVSKRNRFEAEMTRVEGSWKLSSLVQVPYIPV
jgi:Mce-associated membrane protein